jgi:hypothetical protein
MSEKRLLEWAMKVPASWTPFNFNFQRLSKSSRLPDTYLGSCDVFPSVQVASMWNTWRIQRLVVLTILMSCINAAAAVGYEPSMISCSGAGKTKVASIQNGIQKIVDSICASVPYHLDNRTERCSLDNFSDISLCFPAYHHFLEDEAGLPMRMKRNFVMPEAEHRQHVIAQGVWHIINPLSRIMSLCAGPLGPSIRSAVRGGPIGVDQGTNMSMRDHSWAGQIQFLVAESLECAEQITLV